MGMSLEERVDDIRERIIFLRMKLASGEVTTDTFTDSQPCEIKCQKKDIEEVNHKLADLDALRQKFRRN
jgi:predicted  nucleic acid-binding Zn-ribbon protein